MKISIKYWSTILITFLFYSCSGWSKKDKEIYLSECKRAKLDSYARQNGQPHKIFENEEIKNSIHPCIKWTG